MTVRGPRPAQILARLAAEVRSSHARRSGGMERGLAILATTAERRRLAWLARLMPLPNPLAAPSPPTAAAGTVVAPGARSGIRWVSPDLLRLRLAKPAGFAYRAGQSAKLGLQGLARRYSFASAPFEPELEFFIELQAGGRMSGLLRLHADPDAITISDIKGDLQLVPAAADHLMVATVTGIAPFRSMVLEHLHSGGNGRRFILLHGASYQDEFGYDAELRRLAAEHPGRLVYIPSVSRPAEPRNAGWQGATGRVETLVDAVIDQYRLAPATTCLYACGQPAMVRSVARAYRLQGFLVREESY